MVEGVPGVVVVVDGVPHGNGGSGMVVVDVATGASCLPVKNAIDPTSKTVTVISAAIALRPI